MISPVHVIGSGSICISAIGYSALETSTTGNNNTAVGIFDGIKNPHLTKTIHF
jgi:hypothetical protein